METESDTLPFTALVSILDACGARWWPLQGDDRLLAVTWPLGYSGNDVPLVAASIRAHKTALLDAARSRGWDPAAGWAPPPGSEDAELVPGASPETAAAWAAYCAEHGRPPGGERGG